MEQKSPLIAHYENAKLKAQIKALEYENKMMQNLIRMTLMNKTQPHFHHHYKQEQKEEEFEPVTFTKSDFMEQVQDLEEEEQEQQDEEEDEDLGEEEIIDTYKQAVKHNYWDKCDNK